MELNERKKKILAAIVESYIRNGEPVGSKTLLEKLNIPVSSATIRNDMAELSSMGLLEQPHTSAGRIPSNAGYRYYVDHLMSRAEPDENLRKLIESKMSTENTEPEKVLENAGEVLADITNCTAVSTTPDGESSRIRRVEIIPIGTRTVMLVLLTSTGILKSKLCRAESEITPDIIEGFYNLTSAKLVGTLISDISIVTMQTLAASVGINGLAMLPLLAGIAELAAQATQTDIMLEGQSNLLNHRELEENAYELMEFLKKSEALGQLISSSKNNIKVLIGNENRYPQLKNSSIILARYKINDDSGTIGLIGPTRIDYAKLIPSVKYLTDLVGRLLTQALDE